MDKEVEGVIMLGDDFHVSHISVCLVSKGTYYLFVLIYLFKDVWPIALKIRDRIYLPLERRWVCFCLVQ